MERLTERNPSWIDDELWERACEPDCEEIDAVYRKLKDYEDAEEQGRYIKLPEKSKKRNIESVCTQELNATMKIASVRNALLLNCFVMNFIQQ